MFKFPLHLYKQFLNLKIDFFKQFIKKANYFLESESKNEERYLQEILEKELQGKEI